MNSRSRTIASFFSVTMAAMLLGALVTTQIQRPDSAHARDAEPIASPAPVGPGGSITLDTFRDIAKRETPGVVNINTKKTVKRQQRGRDPFHDFFGGNDDMMERFFGPQGAPERQTQQSLGSGFVIDKTGYILTNRHVVEGADEIQVTFASNASHTFDAKLVGKDARTDIALIKVETREPLTVLDMGDSDKADVGEWVMAIGSPFGLGSSVTVGVVSFNGRSLNLGPRGTGVDMIQTDASINPGNSGGPLINTRGQVIGINTLIFTQGVAQSSGVGFAVPINVAKEILPQLRDKGKVTRGWLGVQIQSLTEDMARSYKLADAKGAVVSEMTPGSPAEKAGLKEDDVIVGVDDRHVESNNDLSRYIASKTPGTTVRLRVLRGGSEKAVSVTLGTFPEEGEKPEVEEGRSGKLGMKLRDLGPDLADRLELPRGSKGVVVMDVEPGESAEDAGLQRGDVIVSVNGVSVPNVDAFEAEIDKAKADGVARLRVRRSNQHLLLVLKLK